RPQPRRGRSDPRHETVGRQHHSGQCRDGRGGGRESHRPVPRALSCRDRPRHRRHAGDRRGAGARVGAQLHADMEGRAAALGDRRAVGPRRTARPPADRGMRARRIHRRRQRALFGQLENDCLYRHGTMRGLPHVLIEIRQDLIADPAAARAFAARLAPLLERALAAAEPRALSFTRPLAAKGTAMDEKTRLELEAAAFRRLVAHLRERTDVQNIDLMTLAGFCRNCLGDWYREAAAEKGIALEKDQAREIVYGMPQAEWKKRYQKEASAEPQAAFAATQKTHS